MCVDEPIRSRHKRVPPERRAGLPNGCRLTRAHRDRALTLLLGDLAAARSIETIWRAALLNGLADCPLATATRVVRVIRLRLEPDARELAQRKGNR